MDFSLYIYCIELENTVVRLTWASCAGEVVRRGCAQGCACACVQKDLVVHVVHVRKQFCAHDGFVLKGCVQDDGHSPAAQPQKVVRFELHNLVRC